MSEPVKPIVYYVDNGAPEPIRTALIEGASWWNEAFEAAGFRNAFQVKVLPADADPMDVRYNMINWVHRSTRGWSYGGGIIDPRTGEIIKGNVTLGSLRVRQDFTIGAGLIPQYAEGDDPRACLADLSPDPDYLVALDGSTDVTAMSLARIRQLAAHETGHTLGFAHNFAASTYGRASVMDYPAPWVDIKDGKLDLSHAYATGIGEFDKFAVRYAYSQFAPGANEDQALEQLLEDGVSHGMLYITDSDARPANAAHPLASLWDNGADPIETLKHEMEVRRIGLSQFGLTHDPGWDTAVRAGAQAVAALSAPSLPAARGGEVARRRQFHLHRADAGGTESPRRRRGRPAGTTEGGAQRGARHDQRSRPCACRIAYSSLIPPPAFGYGGGTAEPFDRRTDPTFDPDRRWPRSPPTSRSRRCCSPSVRRASTSTPHATPVIPASTTSVTLARHPHVGRGARRGWLRPRHPGGSREPDGRAADGAGRQRHGGLGRRSGVGDRGAANVMKAARAGAERAHVADA